LITSSIEALSCVLSFEGIFKILLYLPALVVFNVSSFIEDDLTATFLFLNFLDIFVRVSSLFFKKKLELTSIKFGTLNLFF
jgi:hypothetical protein